jgi:hypothetical protein
VVLHFFWPASVSVSEPHAEVALASSESAPPAPSKARTPPGGVQAPQGTGAPSRPATGLPPPESSQAQTQHNDPILPEQPQTPAWRRGKMERLTQVMGRDAERLERIRREASLQGDTEEAKRLDVQLSRQRAHLDRVRAESTSLGAEAEQEATTR